MKFVRVSRAEVSNATTNRCLQFLGRALRHMARHYDASIPDLDLKSAQTREPQERVRELSQAEQRRLFKMLRTDLHPLVKFSLMTGARQASILDLRWRDVDMDASSIRFQIKGGGQMRFPMNHEMRALLTSLPRSNILAHRQFVFTYPTEKTGELHRIPQNSHLFDDFRTALRKAEIEDFRFHDLRHTFTTRMLRQTGNLKLVSRLLGHTSIETTMRYAHVLDDDLHAAMADFSALEAPESRRNYRSQYNK